MPERARILIVEDEPKVANVLVDYLQTAAFETHVLADGREAAAVVRSWQPALVLLDLMLPGRDGIEVCRELRGFTQIPIIMVTARVEEIDRVIGLETGADDYVCKPFSPREVVARVQANLRRSVRSATSAVSGLVVDEQSYTATFDGRRLDLTPVEFRLLRTLAGCPGRVFSRERLLDGLYPDHRVVTDRTVDSHIKNLRRKLASACPDREMIHSIYGVGYKFEG